MFFKQSLIRLDADCFNCSQVKNYQLAGLVVARKMGREKLYCLEAKPLQKLQTWLIFYEQFWDNKLSMLKNVVESDRVEG